jgi:hypothetical protein
MGSGVCTVKILVFNTQFEVWGSFRSGNMREGEHKKRDVGRKYEGRGKKNEGEHGGRMG